MAKPVLAAALAALSLLAGCSGSDATADVSSDDVKVLDAGFMPTKLGPWVVGRQDVPETVGDVENSYLDRVALYGIRKGKLLVATLQVGRFHPGADYGEPGFRSTLLQQIGGSTPRAVRLGGDTVYLTTGVKQALSVWFRDRYLFVLGTREEFDQPRTLLRQALEIEPR